jgi:hypothetical protein
MDQTAAGTDDLRPNSGSGSVSPAVEGVVGDGVLRASWVKAATRVFQSAGRWSMLWVSAATE